MDKQEELILKIISLSEERMRLLNSNNNDSSLNFEKINKRINTIPLEIENLKKELYSMIEVKEEKEKALYLNMLTQEEVAKKIGTTKQHISTFRELGLIQAIKTGKGFMFSQREIERFQEVYRGCDVSNKVKALESYRMLNLYDKHKN